MSHELFHAWNGKRIAPRALLEFDYAREAYTPCLWVMEGITSFAEETSPIKHVSDFTCPVLLFHADDDERVPTSDNDAACRTKFIQTFGRKAFRRPLEAEEVATYQAIFKTEKGFLSGAQAVIETILQSPSFLFWLEDTPNAKWKPYAKASRLSYFIWDTAPDEALLETAARGDLNTPEGIERVARRMLDDPRARDGVDEFVSEWLRFDRVLGLIAARRSRPGYALVGR